MDKFEVVSGKSSFFVVGPFLTEQFCMEMLHFCSYYSELKIGTPVFKKSFIFS